MKSLIYKIVNKLYVKNVIQENEVSICQYGAINFILIIINLISLLLIAAVQNKFLAALLFLLSFVSIRAYAGGIHAKNPVRCYIYSLLLFWAILKIIEKVSSCTTYFWLITVVTIVGCIVIIILSPVETKKRKATVNEKKYFRQIICRNLFCILLISIVLSKYGLYEYVVALSNGIILAAVLLVIPQKGKEVKNEVKNNV